MLARPARHWLPAVVGVLAAMAMAIALTATIAPAATPTCSAVLFLPVDEAGAYMVEQPESAPGAIFCDGSSEGLEFSVVDAPEHGAVSALELNGLGGASFDYAPAPGFAGADSFVLSARDGEGDPVTVRLDVSVRLAGDDAPVCSAQLTADSDGSAYVVEAGAAVAGSIDCFDDEGAELAFAAQAGPEHGVLSEIEGEGGAAASFTYTPSPGYQGSDEFELVANDGTQNSAPMVVEVTVVAAANDPPSCAGTLATTSDTSGNFEVEQGETVHGAVTCVDEEADALDFDIAVPPSHGVLAPLSASGDGGTDIAYTPTPGYSGFDSFRVDVSDGANPAVPVTVRVRAVAARDDPPTCTAQLLAPVVDGAYRVERGETVDGELACEDDEDAPLDFAIASPPQHGSVTPVGEDGRFSYEAPTSYLGPEEFALVANDGGQDSQPVVLEITVTTPGSEPACEVSLGTGANADDEYLIERDTETQGRIVCSDDAGSDLELTVAAPPAHGSISAFEQNGPTSANFNYDPASGYTGPDTFTFAADDGATATQTTVAVRVVAPSPHAPHCQARLQTASAEAGYQVESGETVGGTLTCFDADGDELDFSVAHPPDHGSIAGLEPAAAGVARFTYGADAAWTGPDSFTLLAGDGLQSSNLVEVDVEVVPPVDDPPACTVSLFSEKLTSGAYPAEEGEANPGVVVCVDDEGEPLTFSLVEEPHHGAITGLQGDGESALFDYRADVGYLGSDMVSMEAHDPAGGGDVVALELMVGPAANTAPHCTATLNAPLVVETYGVDAGTATLGEISCEDAELDPLTFSVVQSPSRGTLSAFQGTGDSRSFIYTAASGQSGPDQFSLRANDGRTDSSIVVVPLQIKAPGGTAPGGGEPQGPGVTPVPSTSTPAPPSAPVKPKLKKCRKGFKKKKARGKVKCVKKPKKHKAKKRGG